MLKLALLARKLPSQRCPELSHIYFYPDLSGEGFIQTNTLQAPKTPGSMYIRNVEPHEPRECKIFQHQSLLNMLSILHLNLCSLLFWNPFFFPLHKKAIYL